MNEIDTRTTDQAGPLVGQILDRGELAVPAGGASLAEATAFLNAAAAYQRAVNPAPVVLYGPAVYGAPPRAAHPGIDVNVGGYVPPSYVPPLAPVAETRSWAPLALLVTGTAMVASAFGTAVTGGSPILIGTTLALIAGTGAGVAKVHQLNEGAR